MQIQRLNGKLCQSEAARAEAEKRQDQTANEMMRLTDMTNEVEDARKENDRLTAQVLHYIHEKVVIFAITPQCSFASNHIGLAYLAFCQCPQE